MAQGVQTTGYPLVAREGRLALIITFVLGVFLYLGFGISGAVPAFAAVMFLGVFFRDPARDTTSLPLGIVAPLDGRVTHLAAGHDPWLGRDASVVTVTMGLFDVHSLFSPMEGKIVEQWGTPQHATDDTRAPRGAVAYQVRTDEGDDIVFEIARGQIGSALKFYYQPGERIGHGRRIGYARFGCRITVYAARASRIDCSVGDPVSATNTVLMTLVHDVPVTALSEEER